MLAFLDESGDPGFKTDRGSSPIFVLAVVLFANGEDARKTELALRSAELARLHKGEYRFSKCRDEVRDRFFAIARHCPFRLRAIVVQKEIIYSPRLKADAERFYEYFVKTMLQHDSGMLQGATVVIDGSGDRLFRRRLNAALRRRLREGALKEVKFRQSHTDLLLQLADMCAGGIARSYRRDRPNGDRWRKMLSPRIADIWEFE